MKPRGNSCLAVSAGFFRMIGNLLLTFLYEFSKNFTYILQNILKEFYTARLE